jgi:hypothetical protein
MVCGSLLVLAALQPASVTISPGFTTVGEVLKQLSGVERKSYRTTPKWENQPVFVSFKNASAEVVRARIARLVYGEWQADALVESTRAKGQANLRWTSAIDATLGAESSEIAKEGALTVESIQRWKTKRDQEDAERVHRGESLASEQSTEDQLATRPAMGAARHAIVPLLLKIGAEKLSEIPFGNRVVYATNPNSAQRGLPSGGPALLNKFAVDQAAVRHVLGDSNESPVAFASSGFSTFFGPMGVQFRGDATNPARGLLSIYRSQNLNGFVCEISIADASGRGIADGVHFVPIRPPGAPETKWEIPPLTAEAREAALVFGRGVGSSMPLRRSVGKVTASDGEEATLMITGFGQGLGEPASAELRAKLQTQEPWAILLEESLKSVAKARDVAVLLPDSSLRSVSRALLSPKTLGGALARDPDLELTEKDGTLEIRPSSAGVLAEGTVDRAELRELLNRVLAEQVPTLDALTKFLSGRSGMRGNAVFASGVHQAVAPVVSAAGPPLSFDGQRMLKAWNALGTSNQATLRATGRIEGTALNGVQLGALSEFFLHSVNHPVPLFNGNLGLESDLNGAVSPVWDKERTLLAPRGVEASGALVLAISRRSGYLGVERASGKRLFGGPEMFRFSSGPSDSFFPQLVPTRFFPAEQSRLMFSVLANPLCAQTALLEDMKLTGPEAGFEALPAQFREEVTTVRARPRIATNGLGTINP